MAAPTFMTLPAEIRQMIYCISLSGHRPVDVVLVTDRIPPILQVNRLTRKESLDIWYKTTQFLVLDWRIYSAKLQEWYQHATIYFEKPCSETSLAKDGLKTFVSPSNAEGFEIRMAAWICAIHRSFSPGLPEPDLQDLENMQERRSGIRSEIYSVIYFHALSRLFRGDDFALRMMIRHYLSYIAAVRLMNTNRLLPLLSLRKSMDLVKATCKGNLGLGIHTWHIQLLIWHVGGGLGPGNFRLAVDFLMAWAGGRLSLGLVEEGLRHITNYFNRRLVTERFHISLRLVMFTAMKDLSWSDYIRCVAALYYAPPDWIRAEPRSWLERELWDSLGYAYYVTRDGW